MVRITIFTPTFNRSDVLYRVYDSLIKQSYRDFKWLIVDDGSTDKTKAVVRRFIDEGLLSIEYYYQENQGKHIATNYAVEHTDTELFIIADSDDAFKEDALEILVNAWDTISEEDKKAYKGIICRCIDSRTGREIGKFPASVFDSNDLDAYFRLKINYEKWMLFRTDVLREFPFPDEPKGLKFFPETVIWQEMARKYKTRYIDIALREYFKDQKNALTNSNTPRFKENIFLWKHYINDTFDYFAYKPFLFLKAFVGLNRDNIIIGNKFKETVNIPNKWWKRWICILLYPVSVLLAHKYR